MDNRLTSRGENAWGLIERMRKESQRWTSLSENERAVLENCGFDEVYFEFIKSNIRVSTIDDLKKRFCGGVINWNSILQGYSSYANTVNLRYPLKTRESRYSNESLIIYFDPEDLTVLDIKAKELLGVDPRSFQHNCVDISPDEKGSRVWFRNVFDGVVKDARTITDLLKLNNSDFRYIEALTTTGKVKVFNSCGSSRRWFGQKSFYAFRDRYMEKFLELAEKATFEELWLAIDCFCDCKKYDGYRELSFNEDYEEHPTEYVKRYYGDSSLKEYLKYHKTKRKIAEGLPLKWILPLDQKCMEEIIRKALLKTNFEECLRVYKTRIVGSLKVQILERLSDLASTPEEHFTVASIAHKKGEPFNNVWRKHILLTAKALKAKG